MPEAWAERPKIKAFREWALAEAAHQQADDALPLQARMRKAAL
jgi:hypothetical protein